MVAGDCDWSDCLSCCDCGCYCDLTAVVVADSVVLEWAFVSDYGVAWLSSDLGV